MKNIFMVASFCWMCFFLGVSLGANTFYKQQPRHHWIEQPESIADIGDRRCYYWRYKPFPLNRFYGFKACEIRK